MMKPTLDGDVARVLPRESGFTLLEVLVAFLIAAPTLVLLFGQGATSLGSARTSGLYQQALSRAQSRLDTISDRNLRAGEQSGEEGQGFHWRTRIVPLGSAAPADATLFDVTVIVSWPGVSSGRSLALNSRRLGPASPSQP